MKQLTELRKAYQHLQNEKEKSNSKKKRAAIRANQKEIRNKCLTLYNET